MNNLKDPSYLLNGTQRQMDAYHALLHTGVFSLLRNYDPVLVGTIPLGIDIDQPDLLVICETQDLQEFRDRIDRTFGSRQGFSIQTARNNGLPSIKAGFSYGGFPVQICGEPRPVTEQDAYRLTTVEARLLDIGGERARREIKKLKEDGLDTEAAFARYFHIEGDPKEALLELSSLAEDQLQARVER